MGETNENILSEISAKLNVLIALELSRCEEKDLLRSQRRRGGIGPLARYLRDLGLEAQDIAHVLGSSLQSVRTMLTPGQRR